MIGWLARTTALTLLWMVLQMEASARSALLGVLVALGVLIALQHLPGWQEATSDQESARPRPGHLPRWAIRSAIALGQLAGYLVVEIASANVRLVLDTLRPRSRFRPGVLTYTVAPDVAERQAVVLATLVSLTPGTLMVDTEGQGRILHIHTLYEQQRAGLQREVERYEALLRTIHPAKGRNPP